MNRVAESRSHFLLKKKKTTNIQTKGIPYQSIFTYAPLAEHLLVLCSWTNLMPKFGLGAFIFVPGVGVVPIFTYIHSLSGGLTFPGMPESHVPPLASFPLVHLLLFLLMLRRSF